MFFTLVRGETCRVGGDCWRVGRGVSMERKEGEETHVGLPEQQGTPLFPLTVVGWYIQSGPTRPVS